MLLRSWQALVGPLFWHITCVLQRSTLLTLLALVWDAHATSPLWVAKKAVPGLCHLLLSCVSHHIVLSRLEADCALYNLLLCAWERAGEGTMG